MVFKINLALFENLTFFPQNKYRKEDKLILTEDGIRYSLNAEDSIIYGDKEIPLKPFFQAIKTCERFLWDNHSDWMKESSEQFKLSFYDRNGQATAFYQQTNNGKNPKEIKMCVSYFLNLHDFKFVLGHEVGHFHEYLTKKELKPITSENINIVIASIIIIILTIAIAAFILSFKDKLPEWMIFINLLLSFFLLFSYFSYSASEFNQILKSHFVEFEADLFSSKLFPECNTSYFKKTWVYSDTHPSNHLRILALERNIRIYIPIIVPWWLHYSDSYIEYKQAMSEIPGFLLSSIKDGFIFLRNIMIRREEKETVSNIKNNID